MARKPKELILPDSETAKRIARIREQTEQASDSEVVRRAIRFYEQLLKEAGDLPTAKKSK